jgi:preprotein translocase subunit SecE
MADSKQTSKKSIVAQAEAKAEKMAKESSKAKSKGKKQNRVVKYFKDLKSEFKKVVWPSKQKVINNTAVVLVAMCISSIVIWAIDSGLAELLKLGLGIGS